jgi:hypothetical protein
VLARQGVIRVWHRGQLAPGDKIKERTAAELEAAHIILLLISIDYLNTKRSEMGRAIRRHRSGTARVIPVIIKACEWEREPFRNLNSLPSNRQPVASWKDQKSAWQDVTLGIYTAVDTLIAESPHGTRAPAQPPESPTNKRIAGRPTPLQEYVAIGTTYGVPLGAAVVLSHLLAISCTHSTPNAELSPDPDFANKQTRHIYNGEILETTGKPLPGAYVQLLGYYRALPVVEIAPILTPVRDGYLLSGLCPSIRESVRIREREPGWMQSLRRRPVLAALHSPYSPKILTKFSASLPRRFDPHAFRSRATNYHSTLHHVSAAADVRPGPMERSSGAEPATK